MKIFFDENFSPKIAKALNELQLPHDGIEVLSIAEEFRGVADELWISEIAKRHGVVISQDFNIYKTIHQKELLVKNKIGFIFFCQPRKNQYKYWDWIKLIINNWEEIKIIAKSESKPFVHQKKSTCNKIKKLPI